MKICRNIITFKQNIRYLSIILALLVYGKKMTIMWVILFLVLGNIKKLSQKNVVSETLRLSGYYLIYLMPLVTEKLNIKFIWNQKLKISLLISIIWGLGIFLYDFHKNSILYTPEMVAKLKYASRYSIILMILNGVGAAFCEELFFRAYLIGTEGRNIIHFFFSTFFFVLNHYLLLWSEKFSTIDYIRQFFVSLISSSLYVYSSSIIPSFCLHFFCNGNWILIEIKRYEWFYIKKEKYNVTQGNSDVIDVDF